MSSRLEISIHVLNPLILSRVFRDDTRRVHAICPLDSGAARFPAIANFVYRVYTSFHPIDSTNARNNVLFFLLFFHFFFLSLIFCLFSFSLFIRMFLVERRVRTKSLICHEPMRFADRKCDLIRSDINPLFSFDRSKTTYNLRPFDNSPSLA